MKHFGLCYLVSFALFLASSQLIYSQVDTLADVFPLAIGNQWTYQHYSYYFFAEMGQQWTCTTSSEVRLTVVDAQPSLDSINWILEVHSTPSATTDSSPVVITEHLTGAHRLQSSNEALSDHCVSHPSFGDGVDRYMMVDSLGYARVGYITLKKNMGEIDYLYELNGDPALISSDHLMSSIISSVGEEKPPTLPKEIALCQNYPNPFNPLTVIRYSLLVATHATLKVFDVLGREVTTLVNEELEAGNHETTFDASSLASGVYFYRLKAGAYHETKKLLLLK